MYSFAEEIWDDRSTVLKYYRKAWEEEKNDDASPRPNIVEAVLRWDAEQPSHEFYLKMGAFWSVATGLWRVRSPTLKKGQKKKKNATQHEAYIFWFTEPVSPLFFYLLWSWDKHLHFTAESCKRDQEEKVEKMMTYDYVNMHLQGNTAINTTL